MDKLDLLELKKKLEQNNKIKRKKYFYQNKKNIETLFREINPKVQIKYDCLDLYSVKKILTMMKDTITLQDKRILNQIKRDVFFIDEMTIKKYLVDYTPFMQDRFIKICLAIQGYLKIISIERYEKYFKYMKWSIGNKYTLNDYSSYLMYRRTFFNEFLCKNCWKLFRKEVLLNHEKKCKKNITNCSFCKVLVKKINLNKHEEKCKKNKKKSKVKIQEQVICKYCEVLVNQKKYQKHLKKCPKKKNLNLEKKSFNISCLYCGKSYKTINSLDVHVSRKHKDNWEEYIQDEEVKKRLNQRISDRCNYCGSFVKDMKEHFRKCLKRNKVLSDKKKSEFNCTLNKKQEEQKVEAQREYSPKRKEQILKHKSEIEQYDENINEELLTDEEQYYENIRKKLEYNIRNYSEADKQKVLREYVYTTKKSAIDITLRNEIRSYLYKIYRGYCQICGFTFRKPSDGENSFEMHNWDNKLVVKTKSYLVSSADSLCLCRNCSANIKFGAFNPVFVDKIHRLTNFKDKNLDEIKEFISNKIDRKDVVERFHEYYDWDDMYTLEITMNNEPKNIYMTNGHLIQFIAYLQLEEE